MMASRVAASARTYQLAAAVCAVVVAVYIADGFWKPALLRGPLIYFWAYDFFAWVILPTAALVVLHNATSVSARDYGLSADLGWKDIAFVTPLPLIVLFLVHTFAQVIAGALIGPQASGFSYGDPLAPLGGLRILGVIYLAATAGLWESIFYVGLPWFFVSRYGAPPTAVRRGFLLVSAFLFAAAHFENGLANAIAGFFFQLAAVTWYFKLRTLWPVIGAHALIDVYYFWP